MMVNWDDGTDPEAQGDPRSIDPACTSEGQDVFPRPGGRESDVVSRS